MLLATITDKERFKTDDQAWRKPIAEAIKAQGFEKQAERFCQCHQKVLMVGCTNRNHDPIKIAMPSRCEYRICPVCGRVKGFKIRKKIKAMMGGLPQIRGNRLMFLTLTKKSNGQEGFTKENIKEFYRQVREFMNRFYSIKSNSGAIVQLEIGQDFNLHVHCVVFGAYFPQSILSNTWNEITGDSKIVDIKQIKSNNGAVNYLYKYITKFATLENPDQYALIFKEMFKLRQMRTYGIFYNFKVIKEPIKCPICGESFHYQGFFQIEILDKSEMTYKQMKELFENCEVI